MKLNCASVYVIEPQKHQMLDFTLVSKLLGFFQWNYNKELDKKFARDKLMFRL